MVDKKQITSIQILYNVGFIILLCLIILVVINLNPNKGCCQCGDYHNKCCPCMNTTHYDEVVAWHNEKPSRCCHDSAFD